MINRNQNKEDELNYIRYHYFLDSSLGTNRERLETIINAMVKSTLDWSIGISDEKRKEKLNKYISKISNTKKSKKELNKIFKKRKKEYIKRINDGTFPKPIPKKVSSIEATKKYLSNGKKFPENRKSIENVIKDLDNKTDPSIHFNEHFIGEMHPYGLFSAFIGGYLGLHLNENAIAQQVSPSTSYLEKKVTNWLADIVSNKGSEYSSTKNKITKENLKKMNLIPKGNIVGGGTIANLTALLVARNKSLCKDIKNKDKAEILRKLKNQIDDQKYEDIKKNFKKNKKKGTKSKLGIAELGFKGYQKIFSVNFDDYIILASEQAHYSIQKLAGHIGIGDANCWKIETGNDNKMNINDLEKKVKEANKKKKKILSIVATAGTTGNGAIDPINKIGKIAKKYKIYFHVDAAHSAAFLVSSKFKMKFNGIEKADSITMDGHKMFHTHYSCGGIIFKDKTDPVRFLQQSASYVLDKNKEHYNPGKSTVEGSRGVGGILQLYTAIDALGKEGYDIILNQLYNMTKYLGEKTSKGDFERITKPEINIINFRYAPSKIKKDKEKLNILNKKLNEEMYREGLFYLGNNVLKRNGEEIHVQRAIVMNPYTEKETIDFLVDKIRNVGEKVYNKLEKINWQTGDS